MGKHFTLTIDDTSFEFARKQTEIDAEASLDGICIVRTSVTADRLDRGAYAAARAAGLSGRSGGLLEAVLAQHGWCVPRRRFLITVKNIRVEINSVWPADGPCCAIDRRSAEGIVIVDCRQDAGERAGEIDLADKAVGEDHAQLTCAEVLDPSDTNESIHARHPTAEARCPTSPRASGRAPSFGEVRPRVDHSERLRALRSGCRS